MFIAHVTQSDIRKELIVLVYCLNTSVGAVNPHTLAFALPSAVHLAEAGSKVSEKHIGTKPSVYKFGMDYQQYHMSGYMFCSEVMPRNHELELMLVNTIRKARAYMSRFDITCKLTNKQDIISSSISRICLALDYLISNPFEDVVPAVSPRCIELLAHPSSVCVPFEFDAYHN